MNKEFLGKPIANLKRLGFVAMPYPTELREAVKKTVESWKKFCDLPADIKKGLPYSNNADGVGYELKEGIGKNADRKENFDVTLAGIEWLRRNIEAIESPIALGFVQHATALIGLMKPIILEFADQVEKAYDLEGFVQEVEASEGSFFVRFIHYFSNADVGQETASAHVDQSGFTLHLFESAPGLQCYMCDHEMAGLEWVNMPVSSGKTVIIPSMQMQLRSKGELDALCHRVIATPETARDGRYSAVCFVQLKHTPKYDKEEHGRLQEKKPGFNYGMLPEEFAKLFKK